MDTTAEIVRAALGRRSGQIRQRLESRIRQSLPPGGQAGGQATIEEAGHIVERLIAGSAPARLYEGPNLVELVEWFSLLRGIVLEESAGGLGRPLNAEEVQFLNQSVDAVLQNTIERLASRTTHDIRGGLNGILLSVEVLKHELESMPESLESLEQIKISIEDTVTAMDRLLRKPKAV